MQIYDICVLPLFNFGMAIREGKTSGAIVVSGRNIPPFVRSVRVADEPAVVDAIRIFIDEHPCHCRPGTSQIGLLVKNA